MDLGPHSSLTEKELEDWRSLRPEFKNLFRLCIVTSQHHREQLLDLYMHADFPLSIWQSNVLDHLLKYVKVAVTCSSGGFYCVCGEKGTGKTTIMEKLHSTLLGNRIKCELVGPSNRNGCKSIFSVLTTATDFQKILTDPKTAGVAQYS